MAYLNENINIDKYMILVGQFDYFDLIHTQGENSAKLPPIDYQMRHCCYVKYVEYHR